MAMQMPYGVAQGLTALPESLLVDILARLSPRDLACVDQTCKYLHGFHLPSHPWRWPFVGRQQTAPRAAPQRPRPALSLILHHAESRGSGLVSAGASHCCAIDTQGRVFSWGGDVRHLLWQMDPRHYLWLWTGLSQQLVMPPDSALPRPRAWREGSSAWRNRGAEASGCAQGRRQASRSRRWRTHTLALCNTEHLCMGTTRGQMRQRHVLR